jgi:hypothetical protein
MANASIAEWRAMGKRDLLLRDDVRCGWTTG